MEIAAYITNGKPASFFENGFLVLMKFSCEEWKHLSTHRIEFPETATSQQLRNHVFSIASLLRNCKKIIFRDINGLAVSMFMDLGVSILKSEGEIAGILEYMRRHKVDHSSFISYINATPKNNGDGTYSFNLIEALEQDSSLTSKTILLPFIQNTKFTSLEISCDHIPKWFNSLLKDLKFTYLSEKKSDGTFNVIIRPLPEKCN